MIPLEKNKDPAKGLGSRLHREVPPKFPDRIGTLA